MNTPHRTPRRRGSSPRLRARQEARARAPQAAEGQSRGCVPTRAPQKPRAWPGQRRQHLAQRLEQLNQRLLLGGELAARDARNQRDIRAARRLRARHPVAQPRKHGVHLLGQRRVRNVCGEGSRGAARAVATTARHATPRRGPPRRRPLRHRRRSTRERPHGSSNGGVQERRLPATAELPAFTNECNALSHHTAFNSSTSNNGQQQPNARSSGLIDEWHSQGALSKTCRTPHVRATRHSTPVEHQTCSHAVRDAKCAAWRTKALTKRGSRLASFANQLVGLPAWRCW